MSYEERFTMVFRLQQMGLGIATNTLGSCGVNVIPHRNYALVCSACTSLTVTAVMTTAMLLIPSPKF